MAELTRTLSYKLVDNQHLERTIYLPHTNETFQNVVAFYLAVLQAHQDIIGTGVFTATRCLETLTHRTSGNPEPPYDLAFLFPRLPSGVRRAAIAAAHGLASSWWSNYKRWQKRKARHDEHQVRRIAQGKKRIPFTERPPRYPTATTRGITWYYSEYEAIDDTHLELKVLTEHGWERVEQCVAPVNRALLDRYVEWEQGSPTLVCQDGDWFLHVPVSRRQPLEKIDNQVTANPDLRVLSVDLGLHQLAAMTVMDRSQQPLAAHFVSGKEANAHRLALLQRIYRKQRQTRVIPEDEKPCRDLWGKVSNFDDDLAHQVSRAIVDFALKHDCQVIVFEHLDNLKPQKGTRSRRMNHKLMYWLKARVFKYTQYKGLEHGILCSRVNPRDTSRCCPKCGSLDTERYQQNKLFRCRACGYQANADFVGAVNIGRKFWARYQSEVPCGDTGQGAEL